MDAETKKYISAIAQRIVDVYDISIPLDIDTVVQKLGGRIEICSVDELLYDETPKKKNICSCTKVRALISAYGIYY